jgi:hypothetical protein
MLPSWLVYIALAINFFGTIGYLATTLKGQTRPNRVSWFIWTIGPAIAFAAQLTKGVGVQSWLTFISGFGPLLVLLASFINQKSYWKLTRFDLTCGALSLGALLLWALTREGNLAILFTIAADALACVPTIVKAYREPKSENSISYSTASLSALITLLTITRWNFATAAFPLYLFLIAGFIAILIEYPRKAKETRT